MAEYLSATQAALRLGVHEKTVRRWIEQGRLPAKRIKINRYAIDADDLANLLHGQEPSPDEVLHRLDVIKERLLALEHQIGNLHTELRLILDLLQRPQQPQPSQPREIPTTTQQSLSASQEPQERASSLPEGAILLFQFARNHGLPDGTIKTQARAERFAFSERVKPNRPTEHDKFLTREQQRGVIEFWQRNGTPFMECPMCPH